MTWREIRNQMDPEFARTFRTRKSFIDYARSGVDPKTRIGGPKGKGRLTIKKALALLSFALTFAFGGVALAQDAPHQVVVCKYVGKPGVDETLQTGQNPIVVDSHALEGEGFDGTFPFEFSDAQGRSIAIRYLRDDEQPNDPQLSECPPADSPSPTPPPTTTPPPTHTNKPPRPGHHPRPATNNPPRRLPETGIGFATVLWMLGLGTIGAAALRLGRKRTA